MRRHAEAGFEPVLNPVGGALETSAHAVTASMHILTARHVRSMAFGGGDRDCAPFPPASAFPAGQGRNARPGISHSVTSD